MLFELMLLAAGLALLVKGANLLVDSATRVAISAGISITLVGLSVVAVGTSLPELVVGVDSSIRGVSQVALGDIIGANIANICLIMGVCSLIRPIKVSRTVAYGDIPITAVVTFLLLTLALDGGLGWLDGLVLLAANALYFYRLYKNSRRDRADDNRYTPIADNKDLFLLMAGIAMSLAGGKLTVDSAVIIAGELGISPYIIGITLIAIGTTLPELTTSSLASYRDRGDLVLGNCLGSVSVNTLFILGICALIRPIAVVDIHDIVIVLLASILLIPLVLRDFILARLEGIFLIVYYIVYIAYKIL